MVLLKRARLSRCQVVLEVKGKFYRMMVGETSLVSSAEFE